MPLRFGSLVAGTAIQEILLGISEVESTFDTVRYGTVVPEGRNFPAILHYMQTGIYGAAFSGAPNSEKMNYAVRFIASAGESIEPVLPAAEAAWDLFAEMRSIDLGVGSEITVEMTNEWPQPETVYGAELYPQVGFVLALTFLTGG